MKGFGVYAGKEVRDAARSDTMPVLAAVSARCAALFDRL